VLRTALSLREKHETTHAYRRHYSQIVNRIAWKEPN
jgi:hypothetical protein